MLQCPGCRHSLPVELAIPLHFCPQCRFPLREIAGKYRLEKRLDEGGFGAVYLARHTGLSKHAMRVIKVIKPQFLADEQMQVRFAREIQVTVELSQINDHIVRIYDDFGEDPQLGHYYVMEYLEGLSLQALLQAQGRLPLRLALAIFRQLCDAMGAAHRAGVIHRDLKPANLVLIQRDQNEHFLKVIDFGIARSLVAASQEDLTRGAMGTPRYMPPEQCQNGQIDVRSDIYAMGTILYELLTGHTPFDANELSALLFAHIQTPPPPITTRFPELSLPPGLDAAILQTLAKQPDQRPPDVATLWATLAPFVPAGDATIQIPPGYPVPLGPDKETALPATEASLPPPVAFFPLPTDEPGEQGSATQNTLPSGSIFTAAIVEPLGASVASALPENQPTSVDALAAVDAPERPSLAAPGGVSAGQASSVARAALTDTNPSLAITAPARGQTALRWWWVGSCLLLCGLLAERFWPHTPQTAPPGRPLTAPTPRVPGVPPTRTSQRARPLVVRACEAGATRRCPGPGVVNKGSCRAGRQRCAGGRWGPCVGQVGPGKERCNGRDDDCDGKVDNVARIGRRCTTTTGTCQRSGRWACDARRRRAYCRLPPLSQQQRARELHLRVRPGRVTLKVDGRQFTIAGRFCLARKPGLLTLEFVRRGYTPCALRVRTQQQLSIQLQKERDTSDVRRQIGYCLAQ